MNSEYEDLVEYSHEVSKFNEYQAQREMDFLANLISFRLDELDVFKNAYQVAAACRQIRIKKQKLDLCFDRLLCILEDNKIGGLQNE